MGRTIPLSWKLCCETNFQQPSIGVNPGLAIANINYFYYFGLLLFFIHRLVICLVSQLDPRLKMKHVIHLIEHQFKAMIINCGWNTLILPHYVLFCFFQHSIQIHYSVQGDNFQQYFYTVANFSSDLKRDYFLPALGCPCSYVGIS